MDRREMPLPGSASFFMQRAPGTLSDLNVQSGVDPLSNNMGFQPSIGPISLSMPMESPMSMSGVGMSVPTIAAPPAETAKRKRGRPRKYGPDGRVSSTIASHSTHLGTMAPSQKHSLGSPQAAGKKQHLTSLGELLSGSAGIGFTPHVITVCVGEVSKLRTPPSSSSSSSSCFFVVGEGKGNSLFLQDIATKIVSFSQQGPRCTCVLSASGCVSRVTLRQPSSAAAAGGCITYEGRFEILCLSGSYLPTNDGNPLNRSGGLSVSLASPDGQVIGGGVGGMLIAGSPVQVILGSFIWGGPRTKNKKGDGGESSRDGGHHGVPVAVNPNQNLASSVPQLRNSPVDMYLMPG